MVFVFVFDVVQNLEGLRRRGGLEDDLLETALEGAVLFDELTVLVQGGGADALHLAARQSGLEEVGGIHTARCVASPHHRVQLVDEQDDVGIFLNLGEDGLHTLLELSAVLGAGH